MSDAGFLFERREGARGSESSNNTELRGYDRPHKFSLSVYRSLNYTAALGRLLPCAPRCGACSHFARATHRAQTLHMAFTCFFPLGKLLAASRVVTVANSIPSRRVSGGILNSPQSAILDWSNKTLASPLHLNLHLNLHLRRQLCTRPFVM
jgi:hypothetical protein